MLSNQIKIISPKSKKDFKNYYYLRWLILRKGFDNNLKSAKDEFENNSKHVMASYNKKVIGVGRIHVLNNQSSQIRYMAVDNNYRGQGIGTLILSKLICLAILSRKKYIILHSREDTIAFYEKNGFILIKKSHLLYNKIQHYLMKKEIFRE